MLGPLNHVAIAVPDLAAAVSLYEKLGAVVSSPQELPEHGVTVVFIELPNTKIELLTPLGDSSPIRAFLEKNPAGGIHHICLEVGDVADARAGLVSAGVRLLGGDRPSIGAHDYPVVFAHPKDMFGTLMEFEQAEAQSRG
jgi:methylmalonyl-CoA/ethylmalonyl-CoA epimerase